MSDWVLSSDDLGRWTLLTADGTRHDEVVVVRGFPLSAPDRGVAIVDRDGHERAWIADLQDLGDTQRTAVLAALGQREFIPVIEALESVSSFATPSTWTVRTDRGATRLVLRGEEDIRQLGGGALLVADNHGVQYLVRDLAALDRQSRRLLDRFL